MYVCVCVYVCVCACVRVCDNRFPLFSFHTVHSLQVFHQHGPDEVLGVGGDASKVFVRETEVVAHDVGACLLLTLIQERGHSAQQNVHHSAQTPASKIR